MSKFRAQITTTTVTREWVEISARNEEEAWDKAQEKYEQSDGYAAQIDDGFETVEVTDINQI